jgi:predicted transposase YbfD/YdcC
VFSLIDVEAFGRSFASWTSALADLPDGLVPIDGKTIRRSGGKGQRAMHVVSAWSQANGLVLGQVSTEEKSNEITAIPVLIESLRLDGCIVTIDAMGCQTDIVDAIVEKGANYILAVKDNQPSLHEEIQSHFNDLPQGALGADAMKVHEESDKGHGRLETRKISVSGNVEALVEGIRWQCLASVIRVDSTRTIKEKTSIESRYFISSLPADNAKKFLDAIRGHWEIENKLHWCLDVTFGEDSALLRDRQLAENGSTVRRIALNSLRSHPDFKGNLARATRAAAFDLGFREKLVKSIISNA